MTTPPRRRWFHCKTYDGDSLEMVELVMKMEEDYGLTVRDEDMPKIHSLEDLRRYFQWRLDGSGEQHG